MEGEGGGGHTTRLPGGGGGSYYPHCWMGGAAHNFVRQPLHLAAETTTTAASAGEPAGPPPRLCACRQAQRRWRWLPATQDQRDALAAGSRRHNH